MFKIRPGMPKPPPGFDAIQAKLVEFDAEMKLAVQEESKGVIGQTTRSHSRAHPATRKRQQDQHANEDMDSNHRDRDGVNEGTTHKRTRAENDDEDDDGDSARLRMIGARHTAPQDGDPKHHASSTDDEEGNGMDGARADSFTSAAMPPLWRVAQINHDRTRYVYDAYYRTHRISKAVFDYCVSMSLIDAGLARRWRLPGYEQLCCTACGVPGEASLAATRNAKYALRDQRASKDNRRRSGGDAEAAVAGVKAQAEMTCVCRVPAAQRKSRSFLACAVCGCRGCCSADISAAHKTDTAEDAKAGHRR